MTTGPMTDDRPSAPDSAVPVPAPEDTGPGTMPAWTAALDDDLRAHVEKNGYRDAAAVVKADMHAQRLLGTERLPIPPEGEDLKTWDGWRHLGVPDEADGYAFERPEMPEGLAYDEELETVFRTAAHDLKLAPWQAQGLLEAFARYQGETFCAAARDGEADTRTLEEALRGDWGAAYEANLDVARRAGRAFAQDEATLDALCESLGDAGVLRLFHKIGSLMDEDTLAGDGEPGYGLSPGAAQAEAKAIETKLADLLSKDDTASRIERDRLEARRRSLLARAYPAA